MADNAFQEPIDLIDAHRFCSRNQDYISRSHFCGCFYCLALFLPDEIEEWTGSDSAICPRCHINSVLGSASGYTLSRDFLTRMHGHWFSSRAAPTEPQP